MVEWRVRHVCRCPWSRFREYPKCLLHFVNIIIATITFAYFLQLYPEWNSFQVETVQNFIRVLDLDSLQSSHPVSVKVGHPDEIAQIFDTISYTKGSFLLHMMNTFLGEETFKQGIRNYIDKHKYGNAEQDDLWRALTNEAHRVGSLNKNITLKEIMDTWTLQTGYPVVKVIRDYSANTVTLSQVRETIKKKSYNVYI